MVRKSVRNKCKSSNVFVDPVNTPPKKYLKVRSFKDLIAEEVKLENPVMGMNSNTATKDQISVHKRHMADELMEVEVSDMKKIKLEVKVETNENYSSNRNSEFGSSFNVSYVGGGTGSSSAKLSSVQVLGHDLVYRQYGSMVLFKTSSMMAMLSKSLPLNDTSNLETVVDKSGSGNSSHFLEETWKRAFISWNALRVVLKGGLLDLAIRDLMLSIRLEEKSDTEHNLNQASRCGSIQDSLIINKIDIKFKVRTGIVYLEVLSAFTALGRLHEALEGRWVKIDQLLASHGISQKAAFKKRGAGRMGSGGRLNRNYITLQAFSIISQGHKAKSRAESLEMIVDQIKNKEQSISTEIQQTVDMILRTSCIAPEKSVSLSNSNVQGETQIGHKYCANSLCGRGYHFVARCCGKSHSLELGGQEVGFVRKNGKIFLEKCAAFGALGRMYVIRGSDYRKADKILQENYEDGSVESNFLFEHDDANLGRNRRTHISLDAFIALVDGGFADPCKYESLSSCMKEIRKDFQENQRDNCEDLEVVDLLGSDIEVDEKIPSNVEEVSSGIESEELSPSTPRKIYDDTELESDGDFDDNVGECVHIMKIKIPTKIIDNKIYMEKNAVLTLLNQPSLFTKGYRGVEKVLEENRVCLDEAFLYEGRQRCFVNIIALKIILKSELLQDFGQRTELLTELSKLEKDVDLKESKLLLLNNFDNIQYRLIGGIVHLDSMKLLKLAGFSSSYVYQAPSKANLLLCKILSDRGVNTQHCFFKHGKSKYAFISLPAAHTLLRCEMGPLKDVERTRKLKQEIFDALEKQEIFKAESNIKETGIKVTADFPAIRYKVQLGKLYLHRKSCFECLGLEAAVLSSKKGYSAINNILSLSGLDLTNCYIATKQQRYSYISCTALIHLLQSRDPLIVCLSNKDKFLTGLLAALQAGAVAALGLNKEQGELQLEVGCLQFRCQNDIMFLNRHSAYSMTGLYDQVNWRDDDIYDDPSGVLVEREVDIDTAFLPDGEDRFAWLSVHALFILMGCGPSVGDGGAESYQTVAWRDLLSAVALQEPRLRNHMQMDQFKKVLLGKIMALYIEFLDKNLESSTMVMDSESGIESGTDIGLGSVRKIVEVNNMDTGSSDEITNSPMHSDTDVEEPRGAGTDRSNSSPIEHRGIATTWSSSDQEVPNSATISPQPPSNLHSPFTSNPPSPSNSLVPSPLEALPEESLSSSQPQFPSLTPARYTKLKSDILTAAGGVGGYIGDWEVCQADRVTKLSVRPGYGASRKGSFLQPDYAAILRYTVILSPGKCNLTINEQEINSKLVSTILERGQKEGTLSFLYQLISLRPCFGSFSPELVETVSQSQDKSRYLEELYIDSNFIGTSSSGRTYAGTVRSKLCDFLAADRVSDCCSKCKKLDKLTINRSILTQDEEEIVEKKNDKYTEVTDGVKVGQKSVWQLATTSEDGCSFLCPQVQSFNSSLPHAFDGSEQVTSIVNHRVEISNNLKVQVELSERPVSRTFSEFQKSRQLGPLLDWVAGLRLCVGYPNMQLVKQATFILQNIDRLKPELRKLFKFLAVDNKFTYQSEMNKVGHDGDGTTVGTIRAGSCLVTAEPGADICHQCRLLQEPIEFLSI